jgi:hypothetical protein
MFEEPILSGQRRALILLVRKTAADLTEPANQLAGPRFHPASSTSASQAPV